MQKDDMTIKGKHDGFPGDQKRQNGTFSLGVAFKLEDLTDGEHEGKAVDKAKRHARRHQSHKSR